MASRGERQVLLLAEQLAFAHQVRAIEAVHQGIHSDLLDWGRWGQERFPGRPELARPAIWDLPGEYDPGLDPEATPESPEEPINEKRAIELDTTINDLGSFPTLWARILYVNYVWRPVEWVRPEVVLRRGMPNESYLRQLHLAIEGLDTH